MSTISWQEALHALEEAIRREEDDAAEAAAQQLLQGPTEEVVPRLLPWTQDPDPDRRWWALRVLAEMDHPDIPARLRAALQDPDPGVRMVAALALRRRPDPDALDALLALLGSRDRLLAHLAADALAALGRRATDALMRVVEEDDIRTRAQAVRALAQVKDPKAIPLLFRLLDDPSPLITQWAEEGLERLGIGMVFFWAR